MAMNDPAASTPAPPAEGMARKGGASAAAKGEPSPRAEARGPRSGLVLLVGTRKGAFLLHGDSARQKWRTTGPIFLGNIVNHMVLDPRDARTILMAAKTGHLGPTVFRSTDMGDTWQEASSPPAFPKASEGEKGRAVQKVFWLTPGHPSEPAVWYAGTSPLGIFRSEDGGATWSGVAGFNEQAMIAGLEKDGGTPDGPLTHSILVDPRDASHMYVGLSSGGIFESVDKGGSWKPLNQGVRADFLPDPYPEIGHDPHHVQIHPSKPDRLYHQNHCGIYRLDRPGERWERIGENMPKEVGDIGFPMTLHPRDPDTAWVFPMDGTEVWPRTSPGGRPAVYRTGDAGRSWRRQDGGLPREQAWFTVLRQSMAADSRDPVGLYFGTTSGEIWASRDEGEQWDCIARHMPPVFSLEVAEV